MYYEIFRKISIGVFTIKTKFYNLNLKTDFYPIKQIVQVE